MNKKLREVRDAVSAIKAFQVVGVLFIVVSVGLLALAAWTYGLATAAEEVEAEMYWQPHSMPLALVAAGILVMALSLGLLYITGKARKALEGMDAGEADK